MKTKVIVIGNWEGFENFELGDLKHIPQKGEHIIIDEKRFKKQAQILDLVTNQTGEHCYVGYVIHDFRANEHRILIHLSCDTI